jgi:hypothetical protein
LFTKPWFECGESCCADFLLVYGLETFCHSGHLERVHQSESELCGRPEIEWGFLNFENNKKLPQAGTVLLPSRNMEKRYGIRSPNS